jgi:hypothetical protein
MKPTRRDVIQLAALPLLLEGQEHQHGSAEKNTAPPDPDLLRNYQPKFFGPEDFAALEGFTEILIPTDDTPGAREARCAHYIDFVLQSSPAQEQWRTAMAGIKSAGFHDADSAGRATLMEAFSKPGHACFPAFQLIKQQTVFAYYTSRAGLIENLDYRGNSYNATFPACNHPEHQTV